MIIQNAYGLEKGVGETLDCDQKIMSHTPKV